MESQTPFETFADFYPFYLAEHTHPVSRRLHFAGSTLALVFLFSAVLLQEPWLFLLALVQGYAFAWVGHFFFEHNRPATFKYPLWSFMGDWRMWSDMLRGRVSF